MFIIRTAIWLGIIVTLMPSDKEAQNRMAQAADNGWRQVSTYCDRHETVCENSLAIWSVSKAKAQVAGRMAFDLAMDRLAPTNATPKAGITKGGEAAAAVTADPSAKGAAREQTASAQPRGTLRDEDLAPKWRAEPGRGRI
jgi:hypothetical protein